MGFKVKITCKLSPEPQARVINTMAFFATFIIRFHFNGYKSNQMVYPFDPVAMNAIDFMFITLAGDSGDNLLAIRVAIFTLTPTVGYRYILYIY